MKILLKKLFGLKELRREKRDYEVRTTERLLRNLRMNTMENGDIVRKRDLN